MKIGKIVGWIVGIVVVLAVLAEFGLRFYISNQLKAEFNEQATAQTAAEEPEISFGAVPLLAAALTGKVNHVALTMPSTLVVNGDNVAGQPAANVDLEGFHLDDNYTADQMRITTTLDDDFLLAIFRQQIAQNVDQSLPLAEHLTLTDFTSNPADNSFVLEFVHGAASLTFIPEQRDGELHFVNTEARLLGFNLPEEVTESITNALTEALRENTAGNPSLKISDIQVTDAGTVLTVTGENVPLRQLAQG